MKITSAEFLQTVKWDYLQKEMPEIAFIGRSNVGKSSLMNALLNRKGLARTSSTPGRTRGLNYFLINRSFLFVDLPGYGYAKVPQSEKKEWKSMIQGYFTDHPQRVAAVLIIDARHSPTGQDIQMREWLEFYGIPYITVATKIDKVSKGRRISRKKTLTKEICSTPILFSATDHTGQSDVWQKIGENIEMMKENINWGKPK